MFEVSHQSSYSSFLSTEPKKCFQGRYQGIPRHQRLCQQCSSGEVEDEINFLFKCSKYEPDRKELFGILSEVR
jgi:hypothetical protein